MVAPKVKAGKTKVKQVFTKYVPSPPAEAPVVAPKAKKGKRDE